MTDEKLIKLNIEDFTSRLSSSCPTPGGGGVSALTGALAAALGAMAGEISKEDELKAAVSEVLDLRDRLLRCIDLDAAAFNKLLGVYALDKETPGYDELKEKCLQDAASVPVEVLKLSGEVISLLRVLTDKGSKAVISDSACGASLAGAAIESAYINVIVNTRLMKDGDFAASLSAEAKAARDKYVLLSKDIYRDVETRLSPKSGETLVMRGSPAAEALTEKLKVRIAALKRLGIVPRLAVLSVDPGPSDISYERSIEKAASEIGISVSEFTFSKDAPAREILSKAEEIKRDPSIHGCLVMRPMRDRALEQGITAALGSAKDLDAAAPCTPEAVIELIRYYRIPTRGKKAVVIGRSPVIGKPVALKLLEMDATVTICHSETRALSDICRDADIIVAACGRPGLIDETFLTGGQIVIDVGTNVLIDGTVAGDVAEDIKARLAAAYTPVPGGVGALTALILLSHLIEAAEHV